MKKLFPFVLRPAALGLTFTLCSSSLLYGAGAEASQDAQAPASTSTTTTSATVTTLATTTPTPSPAATPDAERQGKAEELLQAMQADKQFSSQMERVKHSMADLTNSTLRRVNPNMTPEQTANIQKTQAQILDLIQSRMSWDALKPEMVNAYAELFTAKELDDLIAFYKTPAGQKLVEKMPALNAKASQISQRRVMELLPQIQKLAAESAAKAAPSPGSSPAKGGKTNGNNAAPSSSSAAHSKNKKS